MIFLRYLFLSIILAPQVFTAQNTTLDYPTLKDTSYLSNCINYKKNLIINEHALQNLFQKLKLLKQHNNINVTFTHIGDSHIQADLETDILRKNLQSFFGNAGRGLIFPYQLVKSNAPNDLIFQSSTPWQGNRLIKKNNQLPCGITGFVAQPQTTQANLQFKFRNQKDSLYAFNQLSIFIDKQPNNPIFTPIATQCDYNAGILKVKLNHKTTQFDLTLNDSIPTKIYGILLENTPNNGITYHAIGVNGAKYNHYNETLFFWEQLQQLNTHCYILSMGTNEAQQLQLTPEQFIENVDSFVTKIQTINPKATILITTPPISYFKKQFPNHKLKEFSQALIHYALTKNIALWDLFGLSFELQAATQWHKENLLSQDLVHYTRKGYQLQAQLLLNALMESYNCYLNQKQE